MGLVKGKTLFKVFPKLNKMTPQRERCRMPGHFFLIATSLNLPSEDLPSPLNRTTIDAAYSLARQ